MNARRIAFEAIILDYLKNKLTFRSTDELLYELELDVSYPQLSKLLQSMARRGLLRTSKTYFSYKCGYFRMWGSA